MKTVSKKLLSLLLVAILLVSAIPFQAFADPCPDDEHHQLSEWKATGDDKHYKVCLNPDCPQKGKIIVSEPHTYDGEDNECDETGCNWHCTHSKTEIRNKVDATCTSAGYTGDTYCSYCNMKVASGTATGLAAHTFVNGKCSVCDAPQPKDTHVPGDAAHSTIPFGTSVDATYHYVTCTNTNCEKYNQAIPVAHTYNAATGKCTECQYECTHPTGWNVITAQVDPTCDNKGTTAVEQCDTCKKTRGGADINALGHELNALGNCTRPGCTYSSSAATILVEFNATYGEFTGGGKTQSLPVTNGYLTGIPRPNGPTGYTFTGWKSTSNGVVIDPNNLANVLYDQAMGTRFEAQWSMDTVTVNLYAVKNGNYTNASFIKSYQVPKNTGLYNYMNDDARRQDVRNYDANVVGYKWDEQFRDRNGNTLNSGTPSEGQAVYVDLKVMSVRLLLDADGGKLNETVINATYGSVVNLPIPTKENKVFGGWEDVTPGSTTIGSVFDRQFKITMETDMMLKAVWHDKAAVVLRVYLNGDFNSVPHLYEIGEYVVGGNVYYKDIESLLVSRYGGGITVNGLFNAADWASFKNNPNQPRQNDIHLSENKNEITYVYVMLNGYNGTNYPTTPTTPTTNPTVPANGFWVRDLNGNLIWYPAGSSLPAGSGYWILDANGNPNIWVITSGSIIPTYIYVGSNPKTGDTAQIEIAAAVMVLAAAALITIMALRKKKSV